MTLGSLCFVLVLSPPFSSKNKNDIDPAVINVFYKCNSKPNYSISHLLRCPVVASSRSLLVAPPSASLCEAQIQNLRPPRAKRVFGDSHGAAL